MKNILLLLLPILSACVADPPLIEPGVESHSTDEVTEQEHLNYETEMKRLEEEERRLTRQAKNDKLRLKKIKDNNIV